MLAFESLGHSVVEFPVFTMTLDWHPTLGVYVGLEKGMLTGSYAAAEFVRFQSFEDNGAHVIRPELCPQESTTDPRCHLSPYEFASWLADLTYRRAGFEGRHQQAKPSYHLAVVCSTH